MSGSEFDVFINCPFDADYRDLFEAILFTVTACGYRARCALEEDDGLEIRHDKLCRIISQCPRSIHDLSRTELSARALPRFNMPFELGLTMGAKRFGGPKQRRKTALILVREPYRLPAYLSDLAGADPVPHHGRADAAVKLVRRYLGSRPEHAPLPGAVHLLDHLAQFRAALPELARIARIAPEEIDPFSGYRDHMHFLSAFLRENPVV